MKFKYLMHVSQSSQSVKMSVDISHIHNPSNEESSIVIKNVLGLTNPEERESALLELSKRRESNADLALLLWHSPGAIAALLHELVSV